MLNANKNSRENVSRMFQLSADDREARDSAEAGDIIAVIGIDGPTPAIRCAIRITRSSWNGPASLSRVSACPIEPKSGADKQKLGDALTKLRRQDPTFRTKYDEETGETVIAGMGECTWKF